MRALYHELGLAGGFQIGNLKNRDLGGTVVSSQVRNKQKHTHIQKSTPGRFAFALAGALVSPTH
jgi:hypothetical protein